jgi:hypothetical protein
MRILPVLTLFIGATPCLAPGEVVSDLEDGETLLRLETLPSAKFNLSDMEGVARRFLGGAAKGHRTAVLSIYADRAVPAQEAGSCEGNYTQWKSLYDSFPKHARLAAYVISVGSDAVLWLKASDSDIVRKVLSGNDPARVSVDGEPLEILFVNGRIRSRFDGCGMPGTVDPVLYLRTSATLNAEFCRRATSSLAARLGARHILAEFANDPWFPCDGRFPVQYLFLPARPPLSESAFYGLPGFSCGIFCDGEPRCLSSTPTRRVRPPEAH